MEIQYNEKYLTNDLMRRFYEHEKPKTNLLNCPLEKMDQERLRIITELEKKLGIREIAEYFPEPLAYSKDTEFETFGEKVEKYCLTLAKDFSFPVFKLVPKAPNGRTVLYLHGHDEFGVMGALAERHDKIRFHKNLPILLVKEGFTVIAPELAGYGESDYAGFPEGKKPRGGCIAHVAFLTVSGFNLAGFRVFETMRVMDMMEQMGLAMPCIGFGVSGGGQIGEYTGVLDRRIASMALSCYPNLFLYSILNKEHCTDNYVPGILKVGESHEILAAFAPRPLLVSNGMYDRAFLWKGTQIAFPFLEQVYGRAGAKEAISVKPFEGKHEINEQIVMEWFRKQI